MIVPREGSRTPGSSPVRTNRQVSRKWSTASGCTPTSEGVNDVTLAIRYRLWPPTAIEADLGTDKQVSVRQDEDGILLTLDESILF